MGGFLGGCPAEARLCAASAVPPPGPTPAPVRPHQRVWKGIRRTPRGGPFPVRRPTRPRWDTTAHVTGSKAAQELPPVHRWHAEVAEDQDQVPQPASARGRLARFSGRDSRPEEFKDADHGVPHRRIILDDEDAGMVQNRFEHRVTASLAHVPVSRPVSWQKETEAMPCFRPRARYRPDRPSRARLRFTRTHRPARPRRRPGRRRSTSSWRVTAPGDAPGVREYQEAGGLVAGDRVERLRQIIGVSAPWRPTFNVAASSVAARTSRWRRFFELRSTATREAAGTASLSIGGTGDAPPGSARLPTCPSRRGSRQRRITARSLLLTSAIHESVRESRREQPPKSARTWSASGKCGDHEECSGNRRGRARGVTPRRSSSASRTPLLGTPAVRPRYSFTPSSSEDG